MKASEEELLHLREILEGLSSSTGLRLNFNKSCMVPLNTLHEQANALATAFGCQLGALPFTYLGLPLGTTKPRIVEFAPLINQMERRLRPSSFPWDWIRPELINLIRKS
jgi:hypothetical protein